MTQQNQIIAYVDEKKKSKQMSRNRVDKLQLKLTLTETLPANNRLRSRALTYTTYILHESSIIQNETNKHELQVERKLTKQTRFGSRYITDN